MASARAIQRTQSVLEVEKSDGQIASLAEVFRLQDEDELERAEHRYAAIQRGPSRARHLLSHTAAKLGSVLDQK